MSTRQPFLVAFACAVVAAVLPASAAAAVTARYTYTPSYPRVETTTTFDGTASVCDRKPCSYGWRDEGSDGPGGASTLLGTGTMLYQTFHSAGDRLIRLTVTNRKGRSSSTMKTIGVSAAPPADGDGDGVGDAQDVCPSIAGSAPDGCPSPTPDFSFTPSAPSVGQQVSFDASTTACPATPCSYVWSNGSTVFASGQTASFTYQTSGVKTVTLKVTDGQNRSASVSQAVTVIDVSPPPPSPGEPSPIAGMGYHQTFRDDFNTLSRQVWDDHIWYDPAPSSAWSGFQQVDASGVLHLRSRQEWGFPGNTVTTQSSGRTFTRGYFEARMKYSYAGNAAWPSFWMISYRHATNPSYPNLNPYCQQNALPAAECYSAELDVLDNGGWPTELYVGSHRNSCGCYGVSNSLRPSANWFDQGIRLGDDWHTYSMLWTADTVTWYLDGRQVAAVATFDSTNQPMFLMLQNWVGRSNRWGPAISGSESDVQVDYVQVWQK